jgi:hypothetical protein
MRDQNYTKPSLDEPRIQHFITSVRVAQYISGGEASYQRLRIHLPSNIDERATDSYLKAFIIVLALVSVLDFFISAYLSIILRIRLSRRSLRTNGTLPPRVPLAFR